MSFFSSIISAAPIIGSVLGAGASFFGAKEQNKANQAIAASQMAFQERMSGTAYQRAVKDMRLAGINPMLAYSKGGATTPGGAGLPMVNTMDGVGKAVSSALQLRRLNAETTKIEADTGLTRKLEQTEIFKQEEMNARRQNIYHQTQITKANLSSALAAMRAGMTDEQLQSTWFGKISRVIKMLSPFTTTAKQLRSQ